jgi:hypothetical protein
MNPLLLASIGIPAALGGIQGYQTSGGDLGKTFQSAVSGGLLGGATSAIGGGVSRMAGKALGLEGALGKTMRAQQAEGTLPLLGSLYMKAPALANIGTQLVSGAALAPIAGALSNLAGQAIGRPAQAAAQLGAGYVGSRGPGAYNYEQGNAVPSNMGQFGGTDIYGTNPLDVLGPAGMALTAQSLREATAQRDAMRLLYPEVAAASEARSKKEFERQMAAAGIRQNIETAANMIQRSQQSMQQMGQTAAQQMGNALTAQYQYQ